MHVDYIIVGFGLAGMAFASELETNSKSFVVFEDQSQQSSQVAAGFYNPVVLKRFTSVWNAKAQLAIALPFYQKLATKFKAKYDTKMDVHRIFTSIAEQNDWFIASDKPALSDYMHPKIIQNTNTAIKAPFGFGKLVNTGKIDTKKVLKDYKKYLTDTKQLRTTTFQHDDIKCTANEVTYQELTAKYIVFCEGFGLRQNPFFNYLPMQEAKGELITIHAPQLKLTEMLKAAVFVLPLGDDLYKVGATFNWKDKTAHPTEVAKTELLEKLDSILSVAYTVVDHVAGIRPTTKDRRPLVGVHKTHNQLAILNGLGTRGVLLAPSMAKALYGYLENQTALSDEVNITRFE
tara:strand:- start:20219 stop:21259 length:1041 start_codon:yes stop_codon:yes gene_type:complete